MSHRHAIRTVLCCLLLATACVKQPPPPAAATPEQAAPVTIPPLSAATPDGVTPQTLIALAEDINTTLPRQSQDDARWDAVTAGPGSQLTYHYTLLDFDAFLMTLDVDSLRRKVLSGLCTHPKHRILLKVGITSHFTYKDTGGFDIGEFTISPGDCHAEEI